MALIIKEVLAIINITQYSCFIIKINNKTYHKNTISALFSYYFEVKIPKNHQIINLISKTKKAIVKTMANERGITLNSSQLMVFFSF